MEAHAEDFCEEVHGISREVAFGPSPVGVFDDNGKGSVPLFHIDWAARCRIRGNDAEAIKNRIRGSDL